MGVGGEKKLGDFVNEYILGGLDGWCTRHDHEYAINQNSGDDEEGKEWMDQYINGHSSQWIEWIEHPKRIRRRESEYVLPFADDHECLKLNIKNIKNVSKK